MAKRQTRTTATTGPATGDQETEQANVGRFGPATGDQPDASVPQLLTAAELLERMSNLMAAAGKLKDPESFPEARTHRGNKSLYEQRYTALRPAYANAVDLCQQLIQLLHDCRRTVDANEAEIRRLAHLHQRALQAISEVPVAVMVIGQLGMLLDTRPDSVERLFDVQQFVVEADFPRVNVEVNTERHTATVTTSVGTPLKFTFDEDGFFTYEELTRLVGHFYVSGIAVRQECILAVLKTEYARKLSGVPDEEQMLRELFGDEGNLARIKQLGGFALLSAGVMPPHRGRHDLKSSLDIDLNRLAAELLDESDNTTDENRS